MGKLTSTVIEAAIDGFEAQKRRLDAQITELRAMLTGAPESSAEVAAAKGTKRKFSAATLKRMREAQQRRWAKVRGESAAPSEVAAKTKPKRKMSAAARQAIAEAQRKRWAAKRAAA